MSDIWELIRQKELAKRGKIKVKNPKEIHFFFLDEEGDSIIEGQAFKVDLKKLAFIKKYIGFYHAFENGGFSMFKIELGREFDNIGANLGSMNYYRLIEKYGGEKDITLEGFKYETITRSKN